MKFLDKWELGVVVDHYKEPRLRTGLRSMFATVLKRSLLVSWAPFVRNCGTSGKRNMSLQGFLFLCTQDLGRSLHFSMPKCPLWICCKMLPLKVSGTITRLPRSISPSSTDMSSRRGQYGFSAGTIFFTAAAVTISLPGRYLITQS